MNVFQAIIIGLVQGLTEFLPVSSSGHTILAAKLMDVEVGLGFELLIHLASLIAVVIVLNKSVFELIKKPLCKRSRLIIVATIPTVIIVIIFKEVFESAFDGRWLPYCFLLTAALILISGFVKKKPNPLLKDMGYTDALIIGSMQGLAALPGISRSGSTISTSILLGIDRSESAKFSFLLSIPIIIGSSLIEFISSAHSGNSLNISLLPALCGFLAAFISGFFALKFMIKKLTKHFDLFAIYLLALSVFLLINNFFLHWL